MTAGYGQRRWQDARSIALDQARHRCRRCGRSDRLVVHHRDGLGMDGPRATDVRNLEVICAGCHRREHPDLLVHDRAVWPPER
jgi:hypothetical protein